MSSKRIIMPNVSDSIHKGKNNNIKLIQWTSTTSREYFDAHMSTYAIVYLLSGEKEITVGNKCYIIHPGELFLIPKGEYYMSERVTDSDEYKTIAFFFSKELAKEVLNQIGADINIENRDLAPKNITVIQANRELKYFFDTFGDYYSYKTPYTLSIIKLKFAELIYLLLNTPFAKTAINFLINSSKQTKLDLEQVIIDNLFYPLTIKELAVISGRSISQFKREFYKQFGTSPHQWINTKRLEHANFLLTTTSKSIDQICDECGYASRSHFTRLFKKQFALPPAHYRNLETV